MVFLILVARKYRSSAFSHKPKSSRHISMDPKKAEASCDICSRKIYSLQRVTNSPIVNSDEISHFRLSKINDRFKLGGSNLIQNNLM